MLMYYTCSGSEASLCLCLQLSGTKWAFGCQGPSGFADTGSWIVGVVPELMNALEELRGPLEWARDDAC